MPRPLHQVLGHAAEPAGIEQQLHFVFEFLPSIRYGAGLGPGRLVCQGEKGLEALDIEVLTEYPQ